MAEREDVGAPIEDLLRRLAGHGRLGHKSEAARALGLSLATVSRNLSSPTGLFRRRLEAAVAEAEARREEGGTPLPGLRARLEGLAAYREALGAGATAAAFDAARREATAKGPAARDPSDAIAAAAAIGREAGAIEAEIAARTSRS